MFDRSDDEDDFLYELERESETRKLVTYLRRSEKSYARRRAAIMLGNLSEIPDPDEQTQVIDALVNAVWQDDAEPVRAAAVDALYQRGGDALDALFDSMTAGDRAPDATNFQKWADAERPEFRLVAATAIGKRGDVQALPALADLLTDADPRVRARAARACGRIGHPRIVEPLSQRLEDDRELVQKAAANALENIGSDRALKRLIPLTQSDSQSLRLVAVDGLGQFDSLEPTLALIEALSDNSSTVQRTAMLSLLELITDASKNETVSVRKAIARQLQQTDASTAIPTLRDIAQEGSLRSYQHNALWLLSRVAEDEDRSMVIEILIEMLDDPSDKTARVAAGELARHGGPEVEKELRLCVQRDEVSDRVSWRAERVLEKLDTGGELVQTSVDYTYVSDPADYTEQKRDDG